jgi:putative ABC transport system permease protein
MFTAISVITLAVGIGANSAIFSVINGVLLKPLPYPDGDGLIALRHKAPGLNFDDAESAPFLYFTYREQGRSFTDVGLWQNDTGSVTGLAEPEQAPCIDMTAGVLPLLGIQPALGRWFSEQDDQPGSPKTMVLMYGWWQSRFGGDRNVIGRSVLVDGIPRQIIGVMPEKFQFIDANPSFLLPLQFDRSKTYLGNFSYDGVARLKPGVTLRQASADAERLIAIAIQSFPPFPGFTAKMFEGVRLGPNFKPFKEYLVGDISKTLWVLMGTLLMVLLIACANVANLSLVRADGRQQELAIRAALGAGWQRIAVELILESVVLALLGGALGLALAEGAVKALVAMAPAHLPRLSEISIDPTVILFTLAISIIAGILFGLVPVVKYAGPRIAGALRAGGRSLSQSKERHRARSVLVVVQMALALVLLIGSGLMIRTFQALRHVDPGFTSPQDVLTMRISIPETQVKDPETVVHIEQSILDKMAAIPGVTSAAMSSRVPMDGGGWHDAVYARDKDYNGRLPAIRAFKFISPGLLATMGHKLLAGRDFTWTDVYERKPVAMVSENMAREFWGSPQAAIGKQIREGNKSPWREVVAVVGDEREDGIEQKAPGIAYWPPLMNQFSSDEVSVRRTMTYVVRSKRAGSQSLLSEIRQAVWSVNPNLPLASVRTMQEYYDRSLARTSFTLVMLAIAGAMAMLIGIVGIYGVISYSVSQRTREIGIRMALGARRPELTTMFIRYGLTLAAVGAACGLTVAFLTTRILGSMLYGVSPIDPLTYAMVSAVLVGSAVVASYIPALRASTVDPVQALKSE